ncbi:FtsX-like permease family protein [Candidatus Peregrinibacteria bacterium]|nr:FtsX-like permease family protein [Candidatus Peregrinibacteria bacterium]
MKNVPSKINLLEKGFYLSLRNIWRNKFLSLATVFVIGIIIFIFNIILAVNFITKDALSDLSKKIDIVLYLKESTTFADAENLTNELEQIEGVEQVSYTSKEEALNQIKSTHPDITLAFEKYNLGNPLPASISITTTHPKYHKTIAEYLSQDKYQVYLSNIITGEDSTSSSIITSVSKNLLEVNNFTQQIIFWLIITFIIGGTLIILNALQITIFNRRQEITVMKLVGASHWFIRFPFIIESILYGILAVIISFIMILILSKNIQISETSLWSYYTDIQFYKIFLMELIITIVLSIASSMLAVHEYLQKKIIED